MGEDAGGDYEAHDGIVAHHGASGDPLRRVVPHPPERAGVPVCRHHDPLRSGLSCVANSL